MLRRHHGAEYRVARIAQTQTLFTWPSDVRSGRGLRSSAAAGYGHPVDHRFRPDVRFARNGDVSIGYTAASDGPVDMLYVSTFSNLDLNWESPHFARFLDRLGTCTRLIVMDRRGQGVSDRLSPSDIPLLEDNAADLIAVLDAAGSERAVLMGVGHRCPLHDVRSDLSGAGFGTRALRPGRRWDSGSGLSMAVV